MGKRTITVFEHEVLRTTGEEPERLSAPELEALQLHSGENGVPYYSLIHKGIKFNSHVGVIQVGKLTIEVLPKIDRGSKEEWNKILIDMLRRVGSFDVVPTSETSLKVKKNSILELYMESFLNHAEQLLHRGLIKQYRKTETNSTTLKGKLLFQKHITHNLVHHERFFVRYTTYDTSHLLNQLLYKTLHLIRKVNTNAHLSGRVNSLIINFPELPDLRVEELTFDNIAYNRKNEPYRQAMLISRLLLLNYFPDINSGRNYVMAIMFDMNLLWERFVYLSLKKHLNDATVDPQSNKPYWKLSNNRVVNLQPDVIIHKNGTKFVLDTKWKMPDNNRPSHSDLQQMYAYSKYFQSSHTILCYPGKREEFVNGYFHDELTGQTGAYRCSVIRLHFDIEAYPKENFMSHWQQDISEKINGYCSV